MDIPVLFTTYNRLKYTKKSLPALLDNTRGYGEIYIIDNNSTDGTVEYLKSLSDPAIKVIKYNDTNKGVAGAMNQFFNIIKDKHEYFAKVDNDTIVPKNWLFDMVSVLEFEDVDFIQAKHFFVAKGIKDWDDLILKHRTKDFFGNKLIYRDTVGGSGLVGRCSKVGELDESVPLLIGWSKYLSNNGFICAFYDGVTIDVLDIEYYNELKLDDLEYLISTGRMDINSIPPVSIIIPIIREGGAKECIKAIRKHALIPEDKYEIITEVDHNRIGCPSMVSKLTAKTKHDLVMFLGDDTIPQEGFLVRAIKAMGTLPDGWGLVGLNDGIQNGNVFATHWLASKKLLTHLDGGDFFYIGYIHTRCDRELTDKAKELDRYVWARDAIIVHNHPIRDKSFEDDDYKRVYSDEMTSADHKLYIKRKREKGYYKLGIAFPLTDVKVYTSFMVSWTLMDKPGFTFFLPQNPGPIDTIRNNLVTQALREDCTHLIMMDTDQNYPSDTIPKLLSHNKEVVAVNVHRRYPPFDSILLRGELGNYHHVPDDECFSGELIEIDATGCACMLYDINVFLDIPQPWFESYRLEDGRVVGEDVDFCSKLKGAGYKIYADTSIEVGHLSTIEITRDFYKLYKKVRKFEWSPPPLELT